MIQWASRPDLNCIFKPTIFCMRFFTFRFNIYLSFTVWNVSKYGVFSGLYFPAFGLNTEGKMRENTDQKKLRIWTFFTQRLYAIIFGSKASVLPVITLCYDIGYRSDILLTIILIKARTLSFIFATCPAFTYISR